jgi:DNA ligase-1
MLFSDLASYLERLEATSSRIEITKILAELFKKTDASEIDKVVYLSLGALAPSYQGVILNIAEKMMLRILAKAYGRETGEVIKIYKEKGDLGDVAQELSKFKVQSSKFTVVEVHEELIKVAETGGTGSQKRKIEILAKLLQNLDPLSVRFVARIPVGKLRLGFSDKTILDALSWLEKGDKSAKAELEKAYRVLPDPGLLAKKVKENGVAKVVREVKPQVGIPVLPMLAQRIKSPTEMIAKMGKVGVEPKLDGLRLQIHYGPTSRTLRGVRTYTRNLNECSQMFPELAGIGKYLSCREAILDSEAVGLDEETKLMANFQTTMTRRRKHDIESTSKKVGITFFVFDILTKDGKNLMDEPYLVRRKELEETLKPGKTFKLVDYELTDDPQRIIAKYQQKIKEGLEGVIVKKADGKYVPGRTGWRWVKMKQVEKAESKLADTIDAVVMGYTKGKGKRAGFGVGQFLVGVASGGKFVTTSKVGTGLTDAQFRELKKRLTKLEVREKPKEYEAHKNYTPDFWVTPSQVVEIAADEITKSPTHTAGLALRFPRLIRFRDDKSPDQATTLVELKRLFDLAKR